MKKILLLASVFMSFNTMGAIGCLPGQCPERPRPQPSCPTRPIGGGRPLTIEIKSLSSNWKETIHEFAVKNLVHPSWGLAHAERDYKMTLVLAEKEKVDVDLDVLYAASFLHDLGGLKGYEVEGVDHAVRSAELAEKLLNDAGFPMEKFPAVKEIILGHTYYTGIPTNKVAQLFRDADVLDFLGNIGVARILAITSEEGTADGTLKPTVGILKSFAKSMAGKCISESCKELAKPRQAELTRFLKSLDDETFAGSSL